MKFKQSLITLAVAGLFGGVNSVAHASDDYTPAPQPLRLQKPDANAQWYTTPDRRRIVVEQLQQETVLTQGGVLAAWARGYTGLGIKVAVLDQGFDVKHADLVGQVGAYKNFYVGSANTTRGVHGTAMASIIAGSLNNGIGTVGVAPDATLLLAQVGAGGTSTGVSVSAIAEALSWAQQQNADVVNMSIASTYDSTFISRVVKMGDGMYKAPTNYGSLYGTASTFNNLISAGNTRSVVVVAAGNQGLPYSAMPGAYATQVDPTGKLVFGGRWLIVGSVNVNNTISSFSNRAGSLCTNISGNNCLDPYQVKDFYVVAPGERVIVSQDTASTADTKATLTNGTSASAAFVSGGVALLKQAWPHLKASQLVSLVVNTATDLGAPGVDSVYGHGLVNFDKASAPYGDVKYTTAVLGSGPVVTGKPIYKTQMTSANITALRTSSVLSNVQVVDSLSRNYTANFTKAINKAVPTNVLYASPYLALVARGDYKEYSIPLASNNRLTMMQTTSGVAAQLDMPIKSGMLSFQSGTVQETNGFLNNTGTGLLGFGNSSTSYMMLGGSTPISDKINLIGSYGVGFTQTANTPDSMLSLSPTIVSDTWKIGLSSDNVFFSGSSSDRLTLAISQPVGIKRGYATATAVTSYMYSGSDDDVTATPVTSTEKINLASGNRELDLVLGYSVQKSKDTTYGLNVAYQTNVAGQTNNNAMALNLVYRKIF